MHFSNHTGYGEWRGPLLSAEDLREVILGVEERGALARVAAVLSGYQGAEEVGAVVLETVARVKELNPAAVYCCDPVMGDVGRGMFVRPGIPEFMRDQVVPVADVITPNHFELDFLAGRETHTVADLLEAVDAVRAEGPSTVLVTSVLTDETPEGSVDVVAVSDDGCVVGAHAAAPDHPQRLWRRDRCRVPGTPAPHRLGGHRAPAGHLHGLRDPGEDDRGRHPRDPAGRGPGRDRRPAGPVRADPVALSQLRSSAAWRAAGAG